MAIDFGADLIYFDEASYLWVALMSRDEVKALPHWIDAGFLGIN